MNRIPTDKKELEKLRAQQKAREIDSLKKQCAECKLYKPHMTTDFRIRVNLIVKDSPIAWKNKHLFFVNGSCKMFNPKK